MVVHALKRHDIAPGINPIEANAEGNARAPAPITVFVKLITDDLTEACPSCFRTGASWLELRRGGVDGSLSEPYDIVDSIDARLDCSGGVGGVISKVGVFIDCTGANANALRADSLPRRGGGRDIQCGYRFVTLLGL